MTTHGIHGSLLEVSVVSCNNLTDTEWFSRQDPFVSVEYAGNKSRTSTCTDGGKNPTFQERFVYTLIEGLRELTVDVWNSNIINHDTYIGGGRVQLAKAIAQGFDDSTWPLQSKSGRHSGEVRIIIKYFSVNQNQTPANNYSQSAQPVGASHYSTPPPQPYQPNSAVAYPFPPHPAVYLQPRPPFSPSPYQPNSAAYPPPSSYPNSAAYPPPSSYPNSATYPPPSSSSLYPPLESLYPHPYPSNSAYPPQQYGSQYPPSAPYPPGYPPQY